MTAQKCLTTLFLSRYRPVIPLLNRDIGLKSVTASPDLPAVPVYPQNHNRTKYQPAD
jgi:hypothetical protein